MERCSTYESAMFIGSSLISNRAKDWEPKFSSSDLLLKMNQSVTECVPMITNQNISLATCREDRSLERSWREFVSVECDLQCLKLMKCVRSILLEDSIKEKLYLL